jgi:hypothetical protein
MTDNPGTSRRRVGRVAPAACYLSISITQYPEARLDTRHVTFVTESRFVCAVIRVGIKVMSFAEKSSRKKSGRLYRQSSSQDKGSKNG